MACRSIPILLALAAGAGACASAPTNLEPWPAATRAIGSGLEWKLDELEHEARAALAAAGAESAPSTARQRMIDLTQLRLAAWNALEDHCGRLLPVLREAPYDGRGVRAVAESWRALIDALPDVSPVCTELRDETARAMIRANTSVSALQAADEAVALLGEDLLAYHLVLSDAVAEAGLELADLLHERQSALRARRDALAEIVHSAETELRKEAAGAGVARPGAQATLDANRPELARLDQQLFEAAVAEERLSRRFAAAAAHVWRTGFAAREWAVAQREAGSALRKGLPEANFRLLMASAAELGALPGAAP